MTDLNDREENVMLIDTNADELLLSDMDLSADELDLVLGGSSVPSGAQPSPPPPTTYDQAGLIPTWIIRTAISQAVQYLATHTAGPEGPDPNPGSGAHGSSGQSSNNQGGGGGAGGASSN